MFVIGIMISESGHDLTIPVEHLIDARFVSISHSDIADMGSLGT